MGFGEKAYMKIFIDTAELDEIKQAISWGVVDGVTTNPSLIKKAVDTRGGKVTMEEYIKKIVEISPCLVRGSGDLPVVVIKKDDGS